MSHLPYPPLADRLAPYPREGRGAFPLGGLARLVRRGLDVWERDDVMAMSSETYPLKGTTTVPCSCAGRVEGWSRQQQKRSLLSAESEAA